MKIKVNKKLNLPQLIEWAMKNDMHERLFCGDRYGDTVHFDENEDMLCDHVSLTETFTVEVEEEITEDTEIKKLISLDILDEYENEYNTSISDISKFANIKAIYIPNDDYTMTLIWRDGRLIE